jgi:hypothetical protein
MTVTSELVKKELKLAEVTSNNSVDAGRKRHKDASSNRRRDLNPRRIIRKEMTIPYVY